MLNRILAALLAEQGLDVVANTSERHQGFFNVFNGAGSFDVEQLFADWGAALEIEAATTGYSEQ